MAFDIIPNSFWGFPSRQLLQEDDENWLSVGMPSGISVSEDETRVYVTAALPGVDEKDVDITFDKGMLWIKGEAKEEEQDKKRKFYRKSASSFSYRIAVPGDLDLSHEPEATYKNGVMTVSFSKSAQAQPKKITVKTGK